MDELLIEDKKYVSSKQAAKLTGYAKDYVGQLCREGRVPARLVGRSWYVLESAIHDHRFSEAKAVPVRLPVESVSVSQTKAVSSWESPRYESSEEKILPSINRLDSIEPSHHSDEHKEGVAAQLHDSWKAWFDRVAETQAPSIPDILPKGPEHEDEVVQEAHNIPVHHVYQQPPEELLPPVRTILHGAIPPQPAQISPQSEVTQKPLLQKILTSSLALLVLALVLIVLIGSGVFDDYPDSLKQATSITGLSIYNR